MATLTEQMIAAVNDKAAVFCADPSKGLAAGYQPIQDWHTSKEIGASDERIPMRSDFGAWLVGVATKDLPPGSWRFLQAMGGGPGSAFIIPT